MTTQTHSDPDLLKFQTAMSIIEIAQDLGISDFTVTQHRLCILGRLGVI